MVKPTIGGVTSLEGLHAYSVFAMDSNGLVGVADIPLVCHVIPNGIDLSQQSTPYEGIAQKLPGSMKVSRYDEGGKYIAYWDADDRNKFDKYEFRITEGVDCTNDSIGHTVNGEWLKYTVEVEQEGRYLISAKLASEQANQFKPRGLSLAINGMPLCELLLGSESTGGWSNFRTLLSAAEIR